MASDEFMDEMDTELFIETIWYRRYVPTLPELRRLITAFDKLDSQEQMVLSERFRRPSGRTLRDIGERMELTRERVRQIEERALNAMRAAVGAPASREQRLTEMSRPLGRPRPSEEDAG